VRTCRLDLVLPLLSDYTGWSALVADAFIGAGVALLVAPQTGSELRGMIRSYASRARDEAAGRGREAWDTAVERGREYVETGHQAISETGRSAREYVETSKQAIRSGMERVKEPVQGGKQSMKETGRGPNDESLAGAYLNRRHIIVA
jgi:gas vesicle protein